MAFTKLFPAVRGISRDLPLRKPLTRHLAAVQFDCNILGCFLWRSLHMRRDDDFLERVCPDR